MTCTPTCARHCLDPAAPECGSLTAEERRPFEETAAMEEGRRLGEGDPQARARVFARFALALAADLARLRSSLGTGAGESWEVMASRGPER